MIRVAIADDHSYIREGLKKIFGEETDIKLVAEAENSPETIQMTLKSDFDVLILDIRLPGKSGLELLKDLLNIKPGLKIIMLSVHPESLYGMRSLRAGAFGYLAKDAPTEELIKAIRKASEGRKYISENLAERLASSLGDNKDEKLPLHQKLTDREFQVFNALARGKTLKEIAESLNISVSTVNTYRHRIFDKMNLKSNIELVYYAIENNLVDM